MRNTKIERVLEKAEDLLITAMAMGDTNAAKFLLKNLGKHKGYGDKLQLETNGDKITEINITIAKAKDRQIENIIEVEGKIIEEEGKAEEG